MEYNQLFNIPERCLIEKKITKAFFLKNFDLSPDEKKVLNQSIVHIEWLASIKANSANIPSIINDLYAYEEIQIIICTVADNGNAVLNTKSITLIQKNIPYHILLILEDNDNFLLNTCDKKVHQVDNKKRTIEQYYTSIALSKLYKNDMMVAFFNTLNFDVLDKTNLETTYKSYTKAIIQLQSAIITGNYTLRKQSRTEQDMLVLLELEKLEKELLLLINDIKKQSQINQQVYLNVKIQNLKKKIEILKIKLQ
jgi:hypothetical protein